MISKSISVLQVLWPAVGDPNFLDRQTSTKSLSACNSGPLPPDSATDKLLNVMSGPVIRFEPETFKSKDYVTICHVPETFKSKDYVTICNVHHFHTDAYNIMSEFFRWILVLSIKSSIV